MKRLIYSIFAALVATGCASTPSGYTLTGVVPEAWDGKPVMLMVDDTKSPQTIDSTLIAGGKFSFQGHFDIPRRCQVVVFLDPENRRDPNLVLAFPVFLDSTAVNAVCDNSGNKPRFALSGGATQTLFDQYEAQFEPLRQDRRKAFYAYTDVYYSQQKQEEEALRLVKVVDQKAQLMRDYQIQYIQQNPSSALSLHILKGLCDGYSELSQEQMNELFALLPAQLQQSDSGVELQQTIQTRRIALGLPYPDLELKDPSGKTKKISDYVKPGHYTLIELWASWCSPCRAEIPFIKEAYKRYHSQGFNVVSISIDRSEADWKRALSEENLPWEQLLDSSSQAFTAYETSSVPTSLLVDPEGRIYSLNARGGWLDASLREIYKK